MTTKEFLQNSNRIHAILDENELLIAYLEDIEQSYSDYENCYVQFRDKLRGASSALQSNMSELGNSYSSTDKKCLDRIRRLKPRQFIKYVNDLKSELLEVGIFNLTFSEDDSNDIFEQLIDAHTEAYSEKGYRQIFEFAKLSTKFLKITSQIFFTAGIFISKLQLEPEEIPANNQIFEIQIISSKDTLHNFSQFLAFIDILYRDLSKVFSIHIEDYPLTIIKVESGSIWTKLVGHSGLIQLIKDLIFGLAGYLRDLQTGQIDYEKFENNIKKSDLLLDLAIKAKENGLIETNNKYFQKTINKSIVNLSDSLPKTATEVILDERKLLNLDKKQIKEIETKKTLLLKNEHEHDKE